MRDIKFRGHNFVYEKVLPVECINFREGYISLDEGDNSLSDTFDMIDLMQYTGLKDKNGKEVYEGDILLYKNRYKTIVGYKNGSFTRSYHQGNTYLLYDSFIEDGIMIDYEIIGNIYENADLLKD